MNVAARLRAASATSATARTAWSVWALLLGMGMLMLGNGMQGTLLGMRAVDEGFTASVTGVVMGGYFVGFLGGALLTPVIIRRAGHVRVFAALASLASVAILVHAMLVTPLVWWVMRVLTGFAYSGLYIVTESWLNDRATNETRGRLLSVYLLITFVGMGSGQLLLILASPSGYTLFLLNAIILSLALIPILLSGTPEPDRSESDSLSLVQLYCTSPLGTTGILVTGMTQGALFSMGAVFARGYGLSVTEVSLYMAALISGGALAQWPIGRLSDRMDRRRMIAGMGFLVAAVAAAAIPLAALSDTALVITGALFGGTMLPMYSLYLAYVNDHLNPSQMVAASSRLYMAAAAGAMFGPPITGWLMDLAGPNGFLGYFVAIHLLMAGFAVWRMTRSDSPTLEDQIPYAPAPGRTGELAETWLEELTDGAAPDAPASGTTNGARLSQS